MPVLFVGEKLGVWSPVHLGDCWLVLSCAARCISTQLAAASCYLHLPQTHYDIVISTGYHLGVLQQLFCAPAGMMMHMSNHTSPVLTVNLLVHERLRHIAHQRHLSRHQCSVDWLVRNCM